MGSPGALAPQTLQNEGSLVMANGQLKGNPLQIGTNLTYSVEKQRLGSDHEVQMHAIDLALSSF